MTNEATVPVRGKCLGCQTVALRTEYETTATVLLVRILCSVCGGKRIAKVEGVDVPTPEPERPPLRDIRVPEPDVPDLSDEQLRAELDDDPALLASIDRPAVEERMVPPPAPPGRAAAGLAASDAAGRAGWSEAELAEVKRAILAVADRLDEFTVDDVYLELGPGFPVTKGIAGRLQAARNAGVIEATGSVAFSQREGEHGHGQRIGIWRSLRRAK